MHGCLTWVVSSMQTPPAIASDGQVRKLVKTIYRHGLQERFNM